MSDPVKISVMSMAEIRRDSASVVNRLLGCDKIIVMVHGLPRATIEYLGFATKKHGPVALTDDVTRSLSDIESIIQQCNEQHVRYRVDNGYSKMFPLLVTVLTERDSAELVRGAMSAWADANLNEIDLHGPIRGGKTANEWFAELQAEEAGGSNPAG